MKKTYIAKLWFLLFLFATNSAISAPLCSSFFSEARQPIIHYKTEAKLRSEKTVYPSFNNPNYEISASKTWTGVKGPELIQSLLPEGMTLIDHALRGANEEGVVKTNSGNMVHLRARLGKSGTNIGANIVALKNNLGRSQKTLVRDDAEAVIVFIHGGGTKTTGHHVATSLMSWMNVRKVDVVSMDMPWHGEGSRNSFESVKESLEEMRAYVEKYVAPSGKPIFLVGHSMGGVVSDLYMRLFPNDKLFSGVVPLSTVADALPGATPTARFEAESRIEKTNLTNENIPADERALGDSLAEQNKLSPTCGMFCQFLMYGIDWKMPAHQGKDYLPALYVIGEGDGLYQGYQNSFQNNVAKLQNAELKVINQRRDIKDKDGKLITIGHLIFDHKPRVDFAEGLTPEQRQSIINGKIKADEFNRLRAEGKIKLDKDFNFEDVLEPETFVLIRNFITKVINKPLPKHKLESSPLELVVQAYTNNLAFREFAKTYIYQHHKTTPKASSLGEEMKSVTDKVRQLEHKKKHPPGLVDSEADQLAQLVKRQKELSSILSVKGVVSEENQEAFRSLKAQHDEIQTQKSPALIAERKKLKSEFDEKKNALLKAEKIIHQNQVSLTSVQLKKVRAVKDRVFKSMMAQDALVRQLTNAYLANSYSNGQFKKGLFENLPQEALLAFEKFDQLSELYQKALIRYELVLNSEAQAGRLTSTESSPKAAEIEAQVKEAGRVIADLNKDIHKILTQLENTDKELTVLSNTAFFIEKQINQLVGNDYFQSEFYTIEKLLSQSEQIALKNKDSLENILQRIWADWLKIWSLRIADSSESLY